MSMGTHFVGEMTAEGAIAPEDDLDANSGLCGRTPDIVGDLGNELACLPMSGPLVRRTRDTLQGGGGGRGEKRG
jgi:hypothetical protein